MQLLKSADLGRHSLLYLKEIGHGWFGKVSPCAGGRSVHVCGGAGGARGPLQGVGAG